MRAELLDRAIALIREAAPGLHLCRPIQTTSDKADAWWKDREAILLDYERCGVCGKPLPIHSDEEKWQCFENWGK